MIHVLTKIGGLTAYHLIDVVFMAPVHLLFACRYLSFVLLV